MLFNMFSHLPKVYCLESLNKDFGLLFRTTKIYLGMERYWSMTATTVVRGFNSQVQQMSGGG